MKKYLLLLTILIGISFEGQSQITDTICVPTVQMKKIYAAAAQKKVADSLLSIAETQIRELENAVILLGNKDEELKRGYTNQISILNDEIILYKDQIKGFEKLLRKEKRKTGLAILSGIMTTTIMTALFLVNN